MQRFLLLLLLFIPTINFYSHIVIIFFLWLTKFKIRRLQLVLLFPAYVITIGRFAANPELIDLYEFVKYLAIVVVLFSVQVKPKIAAEVVMIAGFINLLGVLLQWLDPYHPFWKSLVNLIYTDNHFYGSMLRLSPRAPGFMTNIIEVAVLFFACTFILKERMLVRLRRRDMLFFIVFLIGLFLSQSKTVIILVTIYWLWYGIKKYRTRAIFIIGILGIVLFKSGILIRIDQLARLSNPLEVSSLLARLSVWSDLVNISTSNVFHLLFGFGRSSFESLYGEIPLDNDLMIMLLNYGLLGFVSYLLIIISFEKYTYIKGSGLILLFVGIGVMVSLLFNIKAMIIFLLLIQSLKINEVSFHLREL